MLRSSRWQCMRRRIFVTEDRDFGPLVYAAAKPTPGVILMRFPSAARATLPAMIVEVVANIRQSVAIVRRTLEDSTFRILFCSPPKKLGKLFVRKTVTALILRLDAHEDFNSGLLPSWRPSQNTLEDFFDFFSFHVEHFSTSHVATHKSQTTKSQTTVLEENGETPSNSPSCARSFTPLGVEVAPRNR